MPGKSPKTIATINFKGGVGKTTVTWCLGDVVSSLSDARVLMFDLDAQMSLTQAIALNEDTGALEERFGAWYQRSIEKRKTIFDALDAFARPAGSFDFGTGFNFIYQLSDRFHFVPSVEDLYWMELEVFDRDSVTDGKGMFFTLQVANATAEYERLHGLGVSIAYPLRAEPWKRRFAVVDPAGMWVDVVEQVESSPGFWEQYLE